MDTQPHRHMTNAVRLAATGIGSADSGEIRADAPIRYSPQEAGLFELLTADEVNRCRGATRTEGA